MRTPPLLVSILSSAVVLAIGCGPGATSAPEPPGGGASAGAESSVAANQQGALVPEPSAPDPGAPDVSGPGASGPATSGPGTMPGAGAGSDREHPVEVCGAMESYLYVARRFQCPGGGNPLGGDPQAGARARLGNVGPHAHGPERDPMLDAHIVDLYEVPCPSGAVQVHVCLYHCPPGRSPIGP